MLNQLSLRIAFSLYSLYDPVVDPLFQIVEKKEHGSPKIEQFDWLQQVLLWNYLPVVRWHQDAESLCELHFWDE